MIAVAFGKLDFFELSSAVDVVHFWSAVVNFVLMVSFCVERLTWPNTLHSGYRLQLLECKYCVA